MHYAFTVTETAAIYGLGHQRDRSDAFLPCFRRFVTHRHTVAHIYYIIILKEYSKQLSHSLSISWHWSPRIGPLFNRLSETGVIGEQRLTFAEFTAFLCRAILNSSPSFTRSRDPNDLFLITPGHFLNTNPLNSLHD